MACLYKVEGANNAFSFLRFYHKFLYYTRFIVNIVFIFLSSSVLTQCALKKNTHVILRRQWWHWPSFGSALLQHHYHFGRVVDLFAVCASHRLLFSASLTRKTFWCHLTTASFPSTPYDWDGITTMSFVFSVTIFHLSAWNCDFFSSQGPLKQRQTKKALFRLSSILPRSLARPLPSILNIFFLLLFQFQSSSFKNPQITIGFEKLA